MSVYVDELVSHPQQAKPGGEKHFGGGKSSCHLTADSAEELHGFAARIGLRREWFQRGSLPHYDLTAGKRIHALAAGAVFVSGIEQARKRVAARKAGAA